MEEQIPTSGPVRVFHVAAVKVSNQPATLTTAEKSECSGASRSDCIEQVNCSAGVRDKSDLKLCEAMERRLHKNHLRRISPEPFYVGFLQNPLVNSRMVHAEARVFSTE